MIYVAIPTYTGQIDAKCVRSVLGNILSLKDNGIDVHLDIMANDCYIARARSTMVDNFLKTDCTHLVFIDSDLSFDDDALLKLIKVNKDIVAGAYPFKAVHKGDYPISIYVNDNMTPVVDDNGLISAKFLPTGMMCIKRDVLKTMIYHHPEWQDREGFSFIFNTGMLIDGLWYGEDYMFCERARKDGYHLWCLPDINFEHIGGQTGKKGNYHQYLMAQPRAK